MPPDIAQHAKVVSMVNSEMHTHTCTSEAHTHTHAQPEDSNMAVVEIRPGHWGFRPVSVRDGPDKG